MGHGHDHGSHAHSHAPSADADRRLLAGAMVVTLGLVVAEVALGFIAGSLALLSDAAHNITDAAAIGIALVAARLAARPTSSEFTFGWRRAEILSAQINGASLLAFGALIGVDAIRRLSDPGDVDAVIVIVVGVLGGAANAGAAWLLSRAERRSLNVEGAMQHVIADLWSSVAAAVAGVVILLTDFREADPIAAMLIVALMFRSGWSLMRESGRVLLEAAPRGMDVEEIGGAMLDVPGVVEVHDLHVWEVTSGFPALAAHVMVQPGEDCHATRAAVADMLEHRFDISHSTLQVEHGAGLLQIDRPATACDH